MRLYPTFKRGGKNEHTFPGTLEEEAHNKDLQRSHGNHHQRLDHTEVENPTLGTPHGTEVTVLTCTEVLLVAGDGGELCRELVDGLLQTGGLFGASALAGGKLGALFVLDLYVTMAQLAFVHCFFESTDMERICETYGDLEVDHLLGEGGHLIVEAEGVLADALGSEDKVTLALLCAV